MDYTVFSMLQAILDFLSATGWVLLTLLVGGLAVSASRGAETLRGLGLVGASLATWALTDMISAVAGWLAGLLELTHALYGTFDEPIVSLIFASIDLGGDLVSWALLAAMAVGLLRVARALSECCESVPEPA
jgi:hypothetical protein